MVQGFDLLVSVGSTKRFLVYKMTCDINEFTKVNWN